MGPKKFNDGYLKDNGIDAESVKSEYNCGSECDIYNGETVTIRTKKGDLVEDTGMTKQEFFDEYGNGRQQ